MISRNFALILVFASFFGLTAALPAMAEEAAPLAADPVAEKRLLELSNELRCLVCQNQTIADSNAELAVDLRREIRGMIQAGKTNPEIIDFMVVRYGDFVLYRPPVKGITLLLWGGPIEDEIAIANNHEIDDFRIGFACLNHAADFPAQIDGEFGIGIGNGLVLADQAT